MLRASSTDMPPVPARADISYPPGLPKHLLPVRSRLTCRQLRSCLMIRAQRGCLARDQSVLRHRRGDVLHDHPPPHFHVRYGRQRAVVDNAKLSVLGGQLSPRVLGLMVEWAAQHQGELEANW